MTIEWDENTKKRIVDVNGTLMICVNDSEDLIPLSDYLLSRAMEAPDICSPADIRFTAQTPCAEQDAE